MGFPQFLVEQEIVDPASHPVDKREGTQHPIHSSRTIHHLLVGFKVTGYTAVLNLRLRLRFSIVSGWYSVGAWKAIMFLEDVTGVMVLF